MIYETFGDSLTFVLDQNIVDFLLSFALDLASVAVLSYLLYFRRHRDHEMAVAISAINLTLFALTSALASYTLSLGVGFALFAVVSVIRLRSDTAGWTEMSYLLLGLSVGLIVGLAGFPIEQKAIYTLFLVLMMAIVDNRMFFKRAAMRTISITLDGTQIPDGSLKPRVEELIGHSVEKVIVKSITANPAQTKVQASYRETL